MLFTFLLPVNVKSKIQKFETTLKMGRSRGGTNSLYELKIKLKSLNCRLFHLSVFVDRGLYKFSKGY